MAKKYNITKDFLIEEYINKNKTLPKVAKTIGCSVSNIVLHLRKFKIKKRKNINLIGQKFSEFTVLKQLDNDRWGSRVWLCQCKCGKEVNQTTAILKNKKISKMCHQCSKIHKSKSKNPLWNGYKDIHGKVWSNTKKGATKRNLSFKITIRYAWDLFVQQNKKCALTKEKIYFAETISEYCKRNFTASLDRIDSTKGYIKGNVQWVHKDVNKMKQSYSQEHFIEMCKKVADNN